MAETDERTQQGTGAEAAPVLRPGRPADPEGRPPARPASGGAESADDGASDGSAKEGSSPGVSGNRAEANQAEGNKDALPPPEAAPASSQPAPGSPEATASQQRKRRLLLRQCDRVLLLDFNLLAMPDWPDNYTVAAARRRRDLWLFCTTVAALVFLSGMTGFVPAWLAGGGFGAFVIILLSGIPAIRRLYSGQDSHLELVMRRHRLLKDARKHIEHLEGETGLAWQCAQMVEFNPALNSVRFRRLVELSEHRHLSRHVTRREHIRLYLIFMLESEKAYSSLQQAFLDDNQQAIDEGWASVAATPEPREEPE